MTDESYELYHYGVKGMKWGIRKEARALKRARTHEYKAKTAQTQIRRDTHAGKAIRLRRKADIIALERLANDEGRLAADRDHWKSELSKARIEDIKNTRYRTAATEGRIARYRTKGDSESKAVLKAVGVQALHTAQSAMVAGAGFASLILLLG